MGAVHRFCDRAMLLERGRVVDARRPRRGGGPLPGAQLRRGSPRSAAAATRAARPSAPGDGTAEILDAWFEDGRGEPVGALAQGEPCTLCTRVRFDIDVEDPFFGATFLNGEHHDVFAATTAWQMPRTGSFRKGEVATLRIGFENWFAPGRYYVAISVAREVSGQDILRPPLRASRR